MTLIAVISANRANQVPVMEKNLEGLSPCWYVPSGQKQSYLNAGALNVIEIEGVMPMKAKQLNAALNDGFNRGEAVVTLDDDFVSAKKFYIENGKRKTYNISLTEAIAKMLQSLNDYSEYKVAGRSASINPLFAEEKIKFSGNIAGQILAQMPNEVRYDEQLKSHVDTEYCFAHHATWGGVIFHKDLLLDFHMYGRNQTSDKKYFGGLAGYRNESTHQHAIEVINKRYGMNLAVNKPGESRKEHIRYKNIRFTESPSWNIK